MSGRRALRVACWNVHRCVGIDGVQDESRIVRVLSELDADVIALQEVENEEATAGTPAQLAHLAGGLGCTPVAGPALVSRRAGFGNALLARHPVRDVQRIDLTVRGREPRGAVAASLDCGGESLRVVSTHLGLGPAERRTQTERLLRELDGASGLPLVLVGDFNEWIPRTDMMRRLRARFGRPASPRTFPSWRPIFALDRAWVDPPLRLQNVEVHGSRLARVASDHLPIVATIAPA